MFKAMALLAALLVTSSTGRMQVQGKVVSDHDPAATVSPRGHPRYVGEDHWLLYGMANADLYAFAEVDRSGTVKRLWWIQFEAYIPTRPELHHTYDSPRHAQIGGLDFYVDTWPRADGEETEPGSDREHVEAMIRKAGYRMPAGMMYVRFVHLADAEKRKELMVIYGEDLAGSAYSAKDLEPNGKDRDRWPKLEAGLIKRGEARVRIQPLSNVR